MGCQDNTILLDIPETMFLIPILEEMKQGNQNDLLFDDFDYQDVAREIRFIKAELNLTELVLYALLRHSGASWAVLKGRMEYPAVLKRGRWKTMTSVQRYEKHGRVAQEWNGYSTAQQAFFLTCADLVKDVMLRRMLPPVLPW